MRFIINTEMKIPREHLRVVGLTQNNPSNMDERIWHLLTWQSQNGSYDVKLKCQIVKAYTGFQKFKKVFANTALDVKLKIIFIKCNVWSVLLYGMESQILKVSTMRNLDAFEMYIYWRIFNVQWIARKTSGDIQRMINTDREHFLITKNRRQTTCLGHVIRNGRYHYRQHRYLRERSKLGEEQVNRIYHDFATSNSGQE